jgi:hypothetical protein
MGARRSPPSRGEGLLRGFASPTPQTGDKKFDISAGAILGCSPGGIYIAQR